MANQHLLAEIFNHDFSAIKDPVDFHRSFFDEALDIDALRPVLEQLEGSSVELGGKTIPAAIRIKGNNETQRPFAILAMLHGNEPAGLAGILLAMALAKAGKLESDVVGLLGNPLAARQYFDHWGAHPDERQEMRDAYRCGLDGDGNLLPDMNRIPTDFMQRAADTPHLKRAQELYHAGQHISGILDIHTARGNMVCITDHKRDADLKHSPIRAVLTELADAISAHSSGAVTVQTLKTILSPLPNIGCQVGIEAGRHEAAETPYNAASFTLAMLYTLGISAVPPLDDKENGQFQRYSVKPKLGYADLEFNELPDDDEKIYMAKACKSVEAIPERCDRVIVHKKNGDFAIQTILEHIISPAGKLCYTVYQYEETEAIKKDQVVALALPSGVEFKAPRDFSGIFFSKSAALYDKDPAVGPWPVGMDRFKTTKFCYPCDVSTMKLKFA